MAENKKKVIIYADWMAKFEALKDDEAGRLIKHFFRYINDLNPECPDRITELSFIDIQSTLKRDLKKWENKADKSRENGKLGGRPQNPNKPTITKQVILEPKEPVIDNVIVNVIVNDIEKEKEIFNNLQFEILNAELWIKDSCRILKIPEVQFKMLLRQFTDELWLKKDFYKEVHEAQSHFINWIKIEITKTSKQNGTSKQSNTDAALAFGTRNKANIDG